MKKTAFGFIFLVAVALFCGCNQQSSSTPSGGNDTNTMTATNSASTASGAVDLTSDKSRESYALGLYLGQTWKVRGLDVDLDSMMRALKDVQSGNQPLLTQEQMGNALKDLQSSMKANYEKAQAAAAQGNETQGAAFLEQNKTQPGVVTLPDGLQYKIITSGTGETPGPTDIVSVNYRGTFVNGTEFDGSEKAGHPVQFPVNQVIPGWTEALLKMSVGSKWQLYIPSNLAYGSNGHPPVIGPNETLIFDVELLSIQHPTPPAPRQPLTSDIIKVPSAEEMKNGAKIETISASDVQKLQQGATNQ